MQSNSLHIRTRFAPSPTGFLHKGHALSALWSNKRAKQLGGELLVRIEDIDYTRCQPAIIADIHKALEWLKLDISPPIIMQSDRRALYDKALLELQQLGVLYPCSCTRKDILAITNTPSAPYPGICRDKERRQHKGAVSWRLDWHRLSHDPNLSQLTWHDMSAGRQNLAMATWGDLVVARRDIGISYHLAHVVDDAAQGITHITRGRDLFEQTSIHRILQHLLNLPEPMYDHHPLLMCSNNRKRKLSKRDGSTALMSMVEQGLTRSSLLDELEPFLALCSKEKFLPTASQ